MLIEDVIKELEILMKEIGTMPVTLKINNHYCNITDVYYDGYLEEIIIEHKTEY